jgi:hypothetical protein
MRQRVVLPLSIRTNDTAHHLHVVILTNEYAFTVPQEQATTRRTITFRPSNADAVLH